MGRAGSGAPHPGAGPRAPLRPEDPPADGRAGPPRLLGAPGVRRRRHGLHQPGHRQRGAGIRRHVAARHHVGARGVELPVAADVGNRGSEAAVSRAAGAGQEDRDVWLDRAGCRQRRPRHSDRGHQERRSLLPHGREDVDLARRRRGQLPRVRVDRPREEEAARSVGHQRVHRSSAASRVSRAAR